MRESNTDPIQYLMVLKRLCIGIHRPKLDALKTAANHPVQGITTSTADSEDLEARIAAHGPIAVGTVAGGDDQLEGTTLEFLDVGMSGAQ